MLIIHVFVHVKPEFVNEFMEATLENARNSVQETGIARFEVIQEVEDKTHFTLVEVYRDEAAPSKHKETAHYLNWRDSVAKMMAEPRSSNKYMNLFPQDQDW
jgi:quinol monooxygenase YgiN